MVLFDNVRPEGFDKALNQVVLTVTNIYSAKTLYITCKEVKNFSQQHLDDFKMDIVNEYIDYLNGVD